MASKEVKFRFVAEKVFSIPGRGVVVTGRLEAGSIQVGTEIGFLGADGRWTRARIVAIEVSRQLVEGLEAGQQASLLLEGIRKDQVTQGTILTEVPEASGSEVPPPSAPQPRFPTTPSVPPPVSSGEAIHPSSSLWRTLIFVILGILFILAFIFLPQLPMK